MKEGQAPVAIYRQDYQPPAYWIDTVDLTFDLDVAKTHVLNIMHVRRNPQVTAQPLRLQGEDWELSRVLVNGNAAAFKMQDGELVLDNLPEGDDPFTVELLTTCRPNKNTHLSGLYASGNDLFTQCESQGFRHITGFLDRPDVMSEYTVTLRANKTLYPVLLSNGNLIDSGHLEDDRHFAKWHDPHKKPSYLFALVAGQFVCREQKITSQSGREHLLQIYVHPGDLEKTEHAMASLMASIAWDEKRFNLPLDLERYMIVATSDFNMGAMENKGLNIFNSRYVLASQNSATDTDYAGIESVIGHEYFHNWTGNRVTCRDWFQLSLKEGLTVFRDQEFSQDMAGGPSARAVKRIEDVRTLRTMQFPEDAGPMAHPVRPDSYLEINNFYTVTIYEKGAEVVRMQQTLVGPTGFARGLKQYLERHDGQAVTCDDFLQAMVDANPDSPLAEHQSAFTRWYSQSGTPRVHARGAYDAAAQTYTLTLEQTCPATPGQPNKQPFVIPITLGLLDSNGAALPLHEGFVRPDSPLEQTIVLTEATTTLTFTHLPSAPIPSLLRNFSAPVILEYGYQDQELLTLLAHDSDPFNRWEAGQRLMLRITLNMVADTAWADSAAFQATLQPAFLQAMRNVLRHPQLDPAFKHLVLTLPSESYIAEHIAVDIHPQRIHAVRNALLLLLALELHEDWRWAWENHQDTGLYRPDAKGSGCRALAGMALGMLCLAGSHNNDPVWPGKTYQQVKDAGNMTDRLNALIALVHSEHELASPALTHFYQWCHKDPLVLDKWFSLQASRPDRDGKVLPLVRHLMQHPHFRMQNPNRARSLIFSYCCNNPAAFHRSDGAGYAFWAECILKLDPINPQITARLARALDQWRKLADPWRSAARMALTRVAAEAKLSTNVREVVDRALHD